VSKRILLIDSDEAFGQGLSSAINARGFVATLATNSEQGMTMAKSESPDLIVVCVEAQPTNGYMLCTRLKKDEQLKGIPVILTSANATPESFEKHKKLKTRAEEYLIKPFEPAMMLEKASALMGVRLPPEQVLDEEIVSVEDEPLGLGDLVEGEDEPISLSEHDAAQAHSSSAEDAVVVEEIEEVVQVEEEQQGGDDDLEMFDKAFDSLGGPQEARTAQPAPARAEKPREISAPDDELVLDGLQETAANESPPASDDELSAQIEARVAELEQKLAEREAELELAKKTNTSSSDLLKLKEAKNRSDKEVLRLKEELNTKEKELLDLQESQTGLETQAQQLQDDAIKREAAAKALQHRADALAAAAKKFERELGAAREEAKGGGSVKGRLAELEGELKRTSAELEGVRTDMNAMTGEKDLITEERDELRKQLEEAQLTAVQNEDRAVKAYQKIKNDEKLREKTRKALQIALQLLEEHADGDEAEQEKQSA
jgi:CheY-like chemotaxis protein/regulator of replication initiation timing